MTRLHRLSPGQFSGLARGAGGVDALAVLRAAQRSKHLLRLRAVIDAAERDPSVWSAASVAGNLAALADVQRRAPLEVRALLEHPQIGAWSAACLARLRSAGLPPVWDLAYLGNIALAAAVRASVDVRVVVAAGPAGVTLPATGRAALPCAGDAVLPAALDDGGVLRFAGGHAVDVHGDPSWLPMRRVYAGEPPLLFAADLDDLDPYRDGYGFPPGDRLDDSAAEGWAAAVREAWTVLCATDRDRASGVAATVRSLIPPGRPAPAAGSSASSRDANGAVALAGPGRGLDVAVTLVHEAQHSALNGLHDLTTLFHPDTGARYCSPWRDDPRPLAGLLHGVYAFLAVAEFWRARHERLGDPAAGFEFARVEAQVLAAHRVLTQAPGLTPSGARVVTGTAETLAGWPRVDVPADARRVAEDLLTEHRIHWRLRNLPPSPATTARLAADWDAAARDATAWATGHRLAAGWDAGNRDAAGWDAGERDAAGWDAGERDAAGWDAADRGAADGDLGEWASEGRDAAGPDAAGSDSRDRADQDAADRDSDSGGGPPAGRFAGDPGDATRGAVLVPRQRSAGGTLLGQAHRRFVTGEPPADPGSVTARLVAGGYATAAHECLRLIAAGAADDDTWVHLAIAEGRRISGGDAALAEMLGGDGRPELLVAVHRRLSAAGRIASPSALAAWLSDAVPA
ncbi:HEXXH motif domain-containing protein [Dactylosporangium sp. NPDC005555]|uniref:HEXXH motif domain-containing protein n=1 Tax=Dactylosporangium sp. NPDC005555 TaxID=3154889 RepID=UPI00339EA7B8